MAKKIIKRDWNQWLVDNIAGAFSPIGNTLLVREVTINTNTKYGGCFGIALLENEEDIVIEQAGRNTDIHHKDLILYEAPCYNLALEDVKYAVVPHSSIKAVFSHNYETQQKEED